jgi:beta-galactosidase
VIPVGKKISEDLRFTTKYRVVWEVPYAPGTLTAVAFAGGQTVASTEVRTAGAPARVVLVPDRTTLHADGEDLSFVTVRIEDAEGNLVPGADNLVRFAVQGAGRIAAVDNGNAASLEPFRAKERKAFSGLALLVVRSNRGVSGSIRVEATSDGLTAAGAVLKAE